MHRIIMLLHLVFNFSNFVFIILNACITSVLFLFKIFRYLFNLSINHSYLIRYSRNNSIGAYTFWAIFVYLVILANWTFYYRTFAHYLFITIHLYYTFIAVRMSTLKNFWYSISVFFKIIIT